MDTFVKLKYFTESGVPNESILAFITMTMTDYIDSDDDN